MNEDEYFINPTLSCESCPHKSELQFGDDYENTACSACPLKHNPIHQRKQIIMPEQNIRLIAFIKRLLYVCRNERRTEILFIMLRHREYTDRRIAEAVNLPRRNVSYHTRIIRDLLPELIYRRIYK